MAEVVAIKPLSNKALLGIVVLSAVVGFVGTLWHAFLPTSARCILQGFGVVLSEPGEMTGLGFLMLLWVWPQGIKKVLTHMKVEHARDDVLLLINRQAKQSYHYLI